MRKLQSQPLIITSEALDAMIAHCVNGRALACCGILAGVAPRASRAYPLRNDARSRVRYHADKRDLRHAVLDIRRRKLTMVAIYHFRPGLAAVPSPTDLRQNAYGDLPRAIIALGEAPIVRLWKLSRRYCEELDWHLERYQQESASRDDRNDFMYTDVGQGDGAKKPPFVLASVLSRMSWWLRPSMRIPIGRLPVYSPLQPEPMWDPELDCPRE
jgi:proteasome lid subunit RPN8/RPN11